MATKKADTPEQIDRMRKELKAELEQLNQFFKHAADEATAEILQEQIDEANEKLAKIEENQVKIVKEEKKRSDPLHKTIIGMAKDMGKGLAIGRGAQRNLESLFYSNKDLVDIYKKDSANGKILIDAAIKNQAKALAMVTGMKAEVLEKQIKASVDIKEALEKSQEPLFAIKRATIEMASDIQNNLKKWPVLGRFFSDAMIEQYRDIAKDIKHIFSHHMEDILKPVEILLEPFKTLWKIGGVLYKFLKNPKPTLVERETARWQDRIDVRLGNLKDILLEATGIARKQFDLAEDEAKARQRKVEEKKHGPMFWIASILGLISGAIAGLLGGVQLQAMGSVVRFLRKFNKGFDDLLTSTGNLFKRIKTSIKTFFSKRFADSIEGLKDLFAAVGKRFKWIKNIFDAAMKYFSFLKGGFVTGFLRGLKWIAWPITILMTVIDFVKGFAAGWEEGGIISAITTGLSEALKGFIYLPAKLIGWIVDKVLGFFDIKVEGGTASKVFDAIDMFFDGVAWIYHSMWNTMLTMAEKVLSYIPGMGGIVDTLGGMKTGIGFNADEDKKAELEAKERKAVVDRTAESGSPEKEKAKHDAKIAAQQKEILEKQTTETQTQTLKETMGDMGDKISNSIKFVGNTVREIPTAPEETYLALMGDSIGGA